MRKTVTAAGTLWQDTEPGDGGAADGWCEHLRLLQAGLGGIFARGGIRTFGSEQVNMVCGLGMVGGQVFDAARSGSSPVVFKLDLAV